jgi:hypothetical protein
VRRGGRRRGVRRGGRRRGRDESPPPLGCPLDRIGQVGSTLRLDPFDQLTWGLARTDQSRRANPASVRDVAAGAAHSSGLGFRFSHNTAQKRIGITKLARLN